MSEEKATPPNPHGKELAVFTLNNIVATEIMVKKFEAFEESLRENGAHDLSSKAKFDTTQTTFPLAVGEMQTGCVYFDIIPEEEDVHSRFELNQRGYEDYFKTEGDSTIMPQNVLARVALRLLNNRPILTLEAWGDVDPDEVREFSGTLIPGGFGRGSNPTRIEIGTVGKKPDELSDHLGMALDVITPNILESDMKEIHTSLSTQVSDTHPRSPSFEELQERVRGITETYGNPEPKDVTPEGK